MAVAAKKTVPSEVAQPALEAKPAAARAPKAPAASPAKTRLSLVGGAPARKPAAVPADGGRTGRPGEFTLEHVPLRPELRHRLRQQEELRHPGFHGAEPARLGRLLEVIPGRGSDRNQPGLPVHR